MDGAAIAGAVLHHVSQVIGCRGLFATHYHHLSSEHALDPLVAVMHMACSVGGGGEEDEGEAEKEKEGEGQGEEEVTFLYKLAKGACPKSYGTNVARLAGLPERVIKRAAAISREREA
jgi:DNA mismatch repair protein MSH6